MTSRSLTKGFTIVELTLFIALISILSTFTISLLGDSSDSAKFEETRQAMQEIRVAILGDNTVDSQGHRTNFGYVGDWGSLPGTIANLTTAQAPAYAYDTTYGVGVGWNGPYLRNRFSAVDPAEDAWGTAWVWSPAAATPNLVSRGADAAAGGTVFDADITMNFPSNTWRGTVYGTVFSGVTPQNGATVEIRYPVNGVLTAFTTATAADGSFSFANVPFGMRTIAVTAPAAAVIGPRVITVDNAHYVIPARLLNVNPTYVSANIQLLWDAEKGTGAAYHGAGCAGAQLTWQDLSANNLDGTLTSFAGCGALTGWNGTGDPSSPYRLELDGANDYVSVGNPAALQFGGDFTIGAWVRFRSLDASDQFIFGHGNNAYSMLANPNFIQVRRNAGQNTGASFATTGVVSGVWYHLMVTKSGATHTIYMNGRNMHSGNIAAGYGYPQPLSIGATNAGGSNFEGSIAFIEMYNRTLTAVEVSERCYSMENRFLGVSCHG